MKPWNFQLCDALRPKKTTALTTKTALNSHNSHKYRAIQSFKFIAQDANSNTRHFKNKTLSSYNHAPPHICTYKEDFEHHKPAPKNLFLLQRVMPSITPWPDLFFRLTPVPVIHRQPPTGSPKKPQSSLSLIFCLPVVDLFVEFYRCV